MTKISLHQGDLPAGLSWGDSIAIDTETLGLSLTRDKLCVVQISTGDGTAHVVQMNRDTYHAPNLKALLSDSKVEKIFHFARFDLGMIRKWLGVDCAPVFCTKIASKLARTYTDRHGLKDVSRELVGVDMSKAQQSSDWGAEKLSDAQLAYAASDVLHLHEIRDRLKGMLEREGRYHIAQACFDFLPMRAELDLEGWPDVDIFAHS
ncbi:MAG: ribonuclease D [Ponticaulis sp.]|nr:ribonuclease D [Ponticaulis sp.]|tara:strand:- start:38034 stop:38651 length:618 start_codon:yes stop_codon:yes gene_type:complete